MSAAAILAAGAAATAAVAAVPLAVASVVSPINRRRDARRNATEAARADERTAELVSQIRAGAEYAALVDSDSGKLTLAAYSTAAGLRAWIAAEGHPDDVPLARRVLDALAPVLNAEQVPVPAISDMPPLMAAAALQVLLHRLGEACDGPQRIRVSIAAGAVAEVVKALPDGRVVDFDPLGEFDPEPLRRAQAEWIAAARNAGLSGWIRATRTTQLS